MPAGPGLQLKDLGWAGGTIQSIAVCQKNVFGEKKRRVSKTKVKRLLSLRTKTKVYKNVQYKSRVCLQLWKSTYMLVMTFKLYSDCLWPPGTYLCSIGKSDRV